MDSLKSFELVIEKNPQPNSMKRFKNEIGYGSREALLESFRKYSVKINGLLVHKIANL
jgi:hypothetical protein